MENHPVRMNLSADHFIDNVRENWSEMSQIASKFPLLETCDLQRVKQCINIGLNCVQTEPNKRPTTSQVIHMLGECSMTSSAILNRCPASSSVSCKSNNATQLRVDHYNRQARQLIGEVVTTSMAQDGSTLIAVRMLLDMFWLKRKCLRRL